MTAIGASGDFQAHFPSTVPEPFAPVYFLDESLENKIKQTETILQPFATPRMIVPGMAAALDASNPQVLDMASCAIMNGGMPMQPSTPTVIEESLPFVENLENAEFSWASAPFTTPVPTSPHFNNMADGTPLHLLSATNTACDLNGLLSQAIPLAQQEMCAAVANAHSDLQHLLSTPCGLPWTSTDVAVAADGVLKPLYVASELAEEQASVAAIITPVVSKQVAVEANLASVSRALSLESTPESVFFPSGPA